MVSGWGRYPSIEAAMLNPTSLGELRQALSKQKHCIARGLGRSYGDSALAKEIISLRHMDHFIEFDPKNGILSCEAGVSLSDILNVIVPQGWFLPVTPGTKYVTFGGAVASDVHGKNHHIEGCFSEFVQSLTLMLSDGSVCECSRDNNPALFHATCGGMGLTGVILRGTLVLKKISSAYIHQTVIKADNLETVFSLFEENAAATYSVAWIDCLAKGKALGRSLLMLGEPAQGGGYLLPSEKHLTVPFVMPATLLNSYAISAFNSLYFHRQRQKEQHRLVHYDPFFYPLDALLHWNRLYGKKGFTQYQCVLPKAAGLIGMKEILKKITLSRRGSFLSVLKSCGPHNQNHLSFPIEGYSLALDFKLESELFDLLNELDSIVAEYQGRVYLTKDVRLSEAMFKRMYPRWEEFLAIRTRYGADQKFHSYQSDRLGL